MPVAKRQAALICTRCDVRRTTAGGADSAFGFGLRGMPAASARSRAACQRLEAGMAGPSARKWPLYPRSTPNVLRATHGGVLGVGPLSEARRHCWVRHRWALAAVAR